jgi:hypothetical protein
MSLSKGVLLALSTNMKLDWKGLTGANVMEYLSRTFTMKKVCNIDHGSLTEREDSVQLASSLKVAYSVKNVNNIFNIKGAELN